MKVKNISGGPVQFRVAGSGDIEAGQIVEVPDDTNLPVEYFEQVHDDQDQPDQPAPEDQPTADVTSSSKE